MDSFSLMLALHTFPSDKYQVTLSLAKGLRSHLQDLQTDAGAWMGSQVEITNFL